MSKKGKMICYGVVGAIGVILIIVSMAGFAYFPPLIQDQVFKNLDLTDSESEGFKNFVSVFRKCNLCFYLNSYRLL